MSRACGVASRASRTASTPRVWPSAQREDGYTLRSALDELNVARQNRDAAVGLFVMSSNAAPAGFPPFARYGHNVVVMWDSEDRSTDAYLHAAVLVALALASRTQRRETVDEAVELEAGPSGS